MLLTRDQIINAEDVHTEDVEVPEWGGAVRVRGLTGRERDEWEASIAVQRGGRMVPDLANMRAKLVVKCCLDDEGKRIFTDMDFNMLGDKSGAAISRVYEVAARLSGLTEQQVEEMVEDFGETTSGGSASNSQNGSASQSKNSSTRRRA